MISEEQLSKWEKLAVEATVGPWVKSKFNNDVVQVGKEIKASGTICKNPRENDAVFITTAREAVPALIAEVRTLKRQVEWIASQAPYHESCIYEFQKEKKPNNCDNKCEKCWLKEVQNVY